MTGQMTIFDFIKPQEEMTDLEQVLARGSQYQGGKIRIFALYQREQDPDVRAKWLMKEYGIGGRSLQVDRKSGFVDFDGKGVHISYYQDEKKVHYTWSVVERRIDGLIKQNAYLTNDEWSCWYGIFDRYHGKIPYPEPAYRYPDDRRCSTCSEWKEAVGGGWLCFHEVISLSNDPEYVCDAWMQKEDDDEI